MGEKSSDPCVRSRVNGAGGVVQDQNFRLFQKSAGDAQALLLAAGYIGSALLDPGVISIRKTVDELIRTGLAAGFLTFLQGGVFLSPAQVIQDGAGEEDIFLQNYGHLIPKGLKVIGADVFSSHADASCAHVVQAADQADQAGFAASRPADDADGLSRADVQLDVVQGFFPASVLIGEAHMVEIDASVCKRGLRFLRACQIGNLIQHLRDTFRAGGAHGNHDEDHGEHHQGHQNAHHIAEQGGQIAGGEIPRHDELRAEPGQSDDAAVHHQHHHRVIQRQNPFGFDEKPVKPVSCVPEFFIFKAFPDEGFYHADGGDIFLHAGVQVVISAEDLIKNLRGFQHDKNQNGSQKKNGDQKNGGQAGADEEAHYHAADQHERGPNRDAQDHLPGVLDVGHIRGHPGHQPCGAVFVDVGKRKFLYLFIDAVPQVAGEAAGRLRGAGPCQNAEGQAAESHEKHEASVLQHLLKISGLYAIIDERGCDERDQNLHHHLKRGEKRGEQGIASVFPDLPQKCF